MKPIDDRKITQQRKPSANSASAEHDRVVGAFVARIYRDGSMADRLTLHDWAKATVHTPAVGGIGEGLYSKWLGEQLEALARIEAAAELTKDGAKIDKRLAKDRDAAESDIASLEATIAELQQSLTARRGDLAGVEAEQSELDQARALIGQVEGSAERGGVLGLAWQYARDGEHPFE